MSAQHRHAFLWLGVALALIILFAAGPLISLFIAGGIADALDCKLPIAGGSPCPFLGADLGDALAVMVFLSYLAFWTLPTGAGALVIWFVVACLVVLVNWLRGRRAA